MVSKYLICSSEERKARKWGSRFCSIKCMCAPTSSCDVPHTAQGFIDGVTKILSQSEIEENEEIKHMLTDAVRETDPEVFKNIDAINSIRKHGL